MKIILTKKPPKNAEAITILVGLHQHCKYIFNGAHWHILPVSVLISKMSGKHREIWGRGCADSKNQADSITRCVCLEMILCFLHQWMLCRACSCSHCHHGELPIRQWSDAIDTFSEVLMVYDGVCVFSDYTYFWHRLWDCWCRWL